MSEPQITVYGTEYSGHAHRVVLLLRMLEIPFRFVHTPAEVRRTADFLRLNPLAQIPVVQEGPILLADSNAILVYVAKRYAPDSPWLPEEPVAAARVQRWLSIAAGELAHGPALARRIAQWGGPGDRQRAAEIAGLLFRFMDVHLVDNPYLAAAHPTIADLACYSYTAHAPEGGVSLRPYPAIGKWLSRVEALPRFEPMPSSPLPPEIPRHELQHG
jgi:glutathione S-transferase